MKYVISDIHGCYNEFKEMLKLIDFNKDDELYILGDIFDRGPEPLKVLDFILGNKNIILLKGNHEKFFEDYMQTGSLTLWYHNGGDTTYAKIMNKDFMYEDMLFRYINKLPYIKVVDKFILTHAGLTFPNNYENFTIDEFISIQDEDTCLWDRTTSKNLNRKFKDYTIVIGHTPVQSITDNYDETPYILKGEGVICIDCGCVFKQANGRLSCLRLDDMKEFYI